MATFVAILAGTILGSSLIRIDGPGAWLAAARRSRSPWLLLCALAMPAVAAPDPELK